MDGTIIQIRSKRKQRRRRIIRNLIIAFLYNLPNTNRFITNVENYDVESLIFTAISPYNEIYRKEVASYRTDHNLLQYPQYKAQVIKTEISSENKENAKRTFVKQPPDTNTDVNTERMDSKVTYIVEGSTYWLIVEKGNAKGYFKVKFKSKERDVARKSLLCLPFDYKNSIRTVNLAIQKFFMVTIICNLFTSYLRCYVPCLPSSSWSFRNLRHGFLIIWLIKQTYLHPLIIFCNNILIVIIAPFKQFDYELALSLFVVTKVSAKLFLNIEWDINLPIIIKKGKIRNKISDIVTFGPLNNFNNEDNAKVKYRVPKDNIPRVSKDLHQFDANQFRNTINDSENDFRYSQRRLFLEDSASAQNIKNETLNKESCLSRICNEILEYKTEVVTRISPYLDDKLIFNSVKKCKETVKEIITCPKYYKLFFKQLGKTLAYTLFSSVNVHF